MEEGTYEGGQSGEGEVKGLQRERRPARGNKLFERRKELAGCAGNSWGKDDRRVTMRSEEDWKTRRTGKQGVTPPRPALQDRREKQIRQPGNQSNQRRRFFPFFRDKNRKEEKKEKEE